LEAPNRKFGNTVFSMCGTLLKLKHYADIPVFRSVYFVHFHFYLTGSILNWGRANKTTLLPLNKSQNKAVRALNYNKTKNLSILSSNF